MDSFTFNTTAGDHFRIFELNGPSTVTGNHSQRNVWYDVTNDTNGFTITLKRFENKSHSNPTGINFYKPSRSLGIV